MKKLILVTLCAFLAFFVNAQVADYRNVVTGYYHCATHDSINIGQPLVDDTTTIVVTAIGPEIDSLVVFSNLNNQWMVYQAKLSFDYSFDFDIYWYGNIYPFTDGFRAIEHYGIDINMLNRVTTYTCNKAAPLAIAEENALNGVTMFYNAGQLTINQPNNSINRLRVFTIDGKEVLNQAILSSTQQVPLNASAGLYLVAFYNGNSFKGSKKMMVNR